MVVLFLFYSISDPVLPSDAWLTFAAEGKGSYRLCRCTVWRGFYRFYRFTMWRSWFLVFVVQYFPLRPKKKKQNCRSHGGLTTSSKTSPWVVQFCFFVFSRFLLLPSKVPKILRKSKTLQTLINLLLIYLSSDSILRHFILPQHTLSCVWDM